MRVRVITPARARETKANASVQCIDVPKTASIRQLHHDVAAHLGVAASVDDADPNECNCKLATKLSSDPHAANKVLVVSGKSEVQHLQVTAETEVAIKHAVRLTFGRDVETRKKVVLIGGQRDGIGEGVYKNMPVVAICSKQRHTPAHARTDVDEAAQVRSKALDLFTSELPIHSVCMDVSLEDSGLLELMDNGTLSIYAIHRSKRGSNATSVGKSAIYRAKAAWEPSVKQSDRATAMFLSSLRVFVSLLQDMTDDAKAQDAVLHIFDTITHFPPAMRTLYILMQDKTPNAAECAALSETIFELLRSCMQTPLIGTTQAQVFLGCRLLFGFILESAKGLKLPDNITAPPYLSSFETVDIRDHMTFEPIRHLVSSNKGLIERALHQAFQPGLVLAKSLLQDSAIEVPKDAALTRLALLSGGAAKEIVAFSMTKLRADHAYLDNGNLASVVDVNELSDLETLPELAGRNKLAVHTPSQLTSAVTPCLTFDRAGFLACYLGEEACGTPGKSSIIFSPKGGEATVDTAVVEQLLAPILRQYQADGTVVFDGIGGAATRSLQSPDEILMFCVDCSASMREATDFDDVNSHDPRLSSDVEGPGMVEPEFYTRVTLDELKRRLDSYENLADIIAIVAGVPAAQRRAATNSVITIYRRMLFTKIEKKSKELGRLRNSLFGARNRIQDLTGDLVYLKELWAGLQTHETAAQDFLIYRALNTPGDALRPWTWSLGDAMPASAAALRLPTLSDDITAVPDQLRCPISHAVMEDAVTSCDGFTYDRPAITQWLSIRQSSPMTGLALANASLAHNEDVSDAAASWIKGEGLTSSDGSAGDEGPISKRPRTQAIEIVFESRVHTFRRKVPPSLSLQGLYQLAFRGLKGRYSIFQLSSQRCGTVRPTTDQTLSSTHFKDGDHVTIRIADDSAASVSAGGSLSTAFRNSQSCLIKVYSSASDMRFAFWMDRHTTKTLESILWKHWRNFFKNLPMAAVMIEMLHLQPKLLDVEVSCPTTGVQPCLWYHSLRGCHANSFSFRYGWASNTVAMAAWLALRKRRQRNLARSLPRCIVAAISAKRKCTRTTTACSAATRARLC